MVAAEDDDGVIGKLQVFQRLDERADVVVDEAAGAVVRPPRLLDLLVAKVLVPQVADLQETLAVWVLLLLGDLDLGQSDVYAFIPIPVLLGDGVRIMRVCQRDL